MGMLLLKKVRMTMKTNACEMTGLIHVHYVTGNRAWGQLTDSKRSTTMSKSASVGTAQVGMAALSATEVDLL